MQCQKHLTSFEEIIIELSYNCNLSCKMCGFGKQYNLFNKEKFMTFERYRSILQQVGGRTNRIRLNGRGESTIHPDFMDILEYTKECFPDVGINLFSNFSFNNMKLLGSLSRNNVQLFISMDSPNPEELSDIRKGAVFQYIAENIGYLKNMKTRPFIIFTIQEANIHQIFGIGQFAFEENCHILYNTIRMDKGIESFQAAVKKNQLYIEKQFLEVSQLFHESNLQALYPDQLSGIQLAVVGSMKTHGAMQNCPSLSKELCIFYDGAVTPCNMFNPFIYGNIFKESLEDIWNSEERSAFLTTYKQHYYCQNCANLGR